MQKTIYIPFEKLSVLKEYTDPDKFVIGAEENAPVGGNCAHIGKKKVIKESYGRQINWDDVNTISFTVNPEYCDDEELQEYMEENEVSYDEAKLKNTLFDIDFEDRDYQYIANIQETYEMIFDYDEIDDDEIKELILNTWKANPNKKEYRIDDIQFNKWYNCSDIYEAAKHIFNTSEAYEEGMHGYVLQDGTIILMGIGSDHNEITALHGINEKWQFIEMGNPSFYGNNLRVGGLLTYDQQEVIGRMIRIYSDRDLYVSFLGGPKGEQSCRYLQPNYRRVFADIERYYNDGIIPLGESIEKKKVLKEGLSSILYHYTGIWDLIDIYENERIPLRYYSKDGMYELSTTRQLNSTIGYPSAHNTASMHQAEYDTCIVRLTLNGDKLQNNYKGKQYNHFPPYGENPSEKAKAEIKTNLNFIESEDRILSYDDELPLNTSEGNDRGYIQRIEILVRPDNDIDEIHNPYPSIIDAFDDLLNLGVYAEVYFDEKEFNKLQRSGESLSTAKYTLEEYMHELLPYEDEEDYVDEGIIKENFEPEVEDSEINLSSFKNQDELAPKIWKDGNKLNSKVRMKLLHIADDFWDFVNINWVEPEGILITGSICNFNWSKYSDIDLHIIVDFSKIDDRTEFVQEYFDAKKNEWNNTHEKLKIYGFPVELYVRDIHDTEESTGKYDLENNKWISEPNRNALHDINADKYEIKHIAAKIMTKIDDLSDALNNTSDNDKSYRIGEKAHKLFKKIKKMRKDGLARGGESDPLNIVYKCLRRTEYLDKLWNISNESYDKVNSIYEAISHLKNDTLNEEVVADGNAEHNMYAARWKQEREDLKNFILYNGKMMTSKENGKRYFVYYDKTMSSLIGNNYAICLQYNMNTGKPSGTVYIRALDKFTERLFTADFDTRGRDNVAGNGDDNLNAYNG